MATKELSLNDLHVVCLFYACFCYNASLERTTCCILYCDSNMKCYNVYRGCQPGVYINWVQCHEGFTGREEASNAFRLFSKYNSNEEAMKGSQIQVKTTEVSSHLNLANNYL
jgi:hypothetical protein